MPRPLDRARIEEEFRAAVNMTADELEAWLATPESRRVGFKRDCGESVGHASGRRIVAILRTAPGGLDEHELAHMRKTVGFIRRHRAQEPANMVTTIR